MTLSAYGKFLIFSVIYSSDKKEAPIYYVIPPTSLAYILLCLILSKIEVLPVSTCPQTTIIPLLYFTYLLILS